MFLDSPVFEFVFQEWRLISLLFAVFLFYFHYTSTFEHFRDKGVPYMKPYIFVGNLGPRILMKCSIHEHSLNQYRYFKGLPYGGLFDGKRPTLMIRDPDMIKAVLIRDFDCFIDRRSIESNEPGYLSRSLLNLKGADWKAVRSALTPTFSSSRLRAMLPLVTACSNNVVKSLRQHVGEDLEMKDFWGHFTLDVIGSSAFGIECSTLEDGSATFADTAAKFADMSMPKRMLIFFLLIFAPSAFRFLRLSFMNEETTKVLIDILKQNKKLRRSTDARREDFLQILLDTAKKEIETNGKTVLDEDTIDAQSLLFLIAGYETSSTLLAYASYTLATNPDIQEVLRAHVNDVLKSSSNELSYETLQKMDYLEAVLMETLRLYPPLARLDRVCVKKYTLPGTNVEINPGESIQVPLYGIHMDCDYYENPEKFDPNRFLSSSRPNHLFLAFGAGPRNCIGLRFAMLSTKIALVKFLQNYKILTCDKTQIPLKQSKKGILLKPENGIWLKINEISNH